MPEEYEQIERVGRGGQGECWLVRRKSDGKHLVRKLTDDFVMARGRPLEMRILRDTLEQHKRALNLVDFVLVKLNPSGSEFMMSCYDFYPGGDLSAHVPKNGQEQPESFLWYVFQQMADVLAYLHYGHVWKVVDKKKGWVPIIHCDIKPANIFLRRPRTEERPYPDIVLGEIGHAIVKEGKPISGTIRYWCPLSKGAGNTKDTDVRALGATIHELVHGHVPKH